jgi:hypothetical protein
VWLDTPFARCLLAGLPVAVMPLNGKRPAGIKKRRRKFFAPGRGRDCSGNPFLPSVAKKIGAESPVFCVSKKAPKPLSFIPGSLLHN